jgi:tape measure domain-containing protein
MATSLKELIVTFEANAKPVVNALNQIDGKLKHTTRSLQSTGESFTRLGKEIGLALSLPLAAFGGASVKAIADIQSLEASLTSVLKRYSDGIPIQQTVTNEIQYLKDITEELGSSFTGAVKPYVKYLAASKDNLETNRKVIKSFLGLSVALGLTEDDTKRVVRSLEQMQSKGQVMSEELKLQLGDAVPGAVALFAESMSMGTAEFLKLIEKGEVSSKILSKVADTINKKYGESIEKGAKTIRASTNRISNAFYMLRVNVGRGMDEVFKVNQRMGSFANWLMKVANNFARLDEQGKKVILSTGLLVAGLGPLLLIIGTLAKLLGIVILGFRILTKPLFLIIGLLPKMIAGFRALTLIMAANPLGAFVAATVTIVTYWREIVGLFQKAGSFLSNMGGKLWNILPDAFKPGVNRMKEIDYSPVDYKKAFKVAGLGINSFIGGFNNFLAERNLLPDSYLRGGAYNQPMGNQKTVNNNLTVNIPPGMSGSDATGIKDAVKQALQEENRQSYIELGAQ